MATSRATPQLAFVLHRYDWSETSLILDLFTREAGRVAVAAKGAKRPYSQLRSVLLPFQRLQVLLGMPRGAEAADVVTLRTAEWAGGGAMLSGGALFSGFYLNELLMKMLARHDPHPRLFDAYALTLRSLTSPEDANVEAALRAFELVLLREVGLLPALDVETLTQVAVAPDGGYVVRPEVGVQSLQGGGAGAGLDGACLSALEAALGTQALGALQAACLPALAVLKVQLRGLLHYHLHLSQLRTRQVMLELQQTS